jgi:hypothetical protein
VTINTEPPGQSVTIDGQLRGTTPFQVALMPASYQVSVGAGNLRRALTVGVTAGGSVVHHIELGSALEDRPAPGGATLVVETEPSGQPILFDGVAHGSSPLVIADVVPGEHELIVTTPAGSIRRTLVAKAAEKLSLVVSSAASPAPGWLKVDSAVRLDLREHGKLVGTTDVEHVMLPAGSHEIELVSNAVGYRSVQHIDVRPGKVTTIPVELPNGLLSINAQPWAEVWIDEERVGETPIANITRRVGTHDIVLRHPQLGERHAQVLVSLGQPVRLSVDMRQKQQ